jgi:putative transposase
VKFVKEECLSKLFLFGERPYPVLCKRIVRIITPSATTKEKGNLLLFVPAMATPSMDRVQCRERLGGLLHYYHREAA